MPFLRPVNVKHAWAGLRPGTADEMPILGPVEGIAGYYNACGHFRTGILNSPLTGLLLAKLLTGAPLSFPIEPFFLSRFASRDRGGGNTVAGPRNRGGGGTKTSIANG